MIYAVRSISAVIALGLLAILGGCGPPSRVSVKSLGTDEPLACVSFGEVQGTEVCWAVGDNSYAFRPALYAPYPGFPAMWCVALSLSNDKPAAVYIWHVRNTPGYLVYVLEDIVMDLSAGPVIRAEGKARVLSVNRKGEVIEGLPSPVSPRTDVVTIVLRRDQGKCSSNLKTAIDELLPIAKKFLFKSKRRPADGA